MEGSGHKIVFHTRHRATCRTLCTSSASGSDTPHRSTRPQLCLPWRKEGNGGRPEQEGKRDPLLLYRAVGHKIHDQNPREYRAAGL